MDYGSGSGSNPPPNVSIPILQRLDVEHFEALPEWKAGIVRIVSRSILANDKGQFLDEDGEILPLGGQPVLCHSVCTGFIVNEGFIVTAAHGVCDWYHHSNALISGFRLRSLEITVIAGVELQEGIITSAVAVDTGRFGLTALAQLVSPFIFVQASR